jgi:Tol biopolymer transport system component
MNTKFRIGIFFISLCLILHTGCREEPIVLEQFGTVNGQVFDSNMLLPIQGAAMSTSPTTTTINTDSLGFFTLVNIPLGSYSLKAEKEGYKTEFEPINVLENQIVVVNINMVEDEGENLPPVSPQLIAPEEGTVNLTEDVELIWNSGENYVENDLLYDVFLINENAEEIEVLTESPDTSFVLKNLNYNTTYFWYVVAKDGVHPNANSEVFSFKTKEISNNLFLFVRHENDYYQIFSSDADGGNETNLTNNNTNNWCPQYSPDGSLISYISVVDNSNHIFIMDTDGNNSRKITSGVPINYYDPMEMDYSWSPDGTKILYMNFDKLYLQDINITGGPANVVLTSPDGNAFASCDWNGNYILARTTNSEGFMSSFYLYDAETMDLVDVIAYFEKGRTGGPYFSEDGGKIVFTHDEHSLPPTLQEGVQGDAQIFLIDQIATPYLTIALSTDNKPAGTNDISARFSPSGAFIIFSNQNIDGLEAPAVFRLNITELDERLIIFENAMMPDWRNP